MVKKFSTRSLYRVLISKDIFKEKNDKGSFLKKQTIAAYQNILFLKWKCECIHKNSTCVIFETPKGRRQRTAR